ncbi:MAG: TerB family tellurite resistance protein [Methyloligellaceae bacterium]
MTLWNKLKVFVDDLSGQPSDAAELALDELQLAATALLVHATVVDGEVEESERTRLKAVLENHYDLSSSEANRLIAVAEKKEQEAVDLYGFTRVLSRRLDGEGRQKVVEMLWEIVMADGVVHEFEANLVWRAAELLGVSARDRIRIRKIVEGRQRGDVQSDG